MGGLADSYRRGKDIWRREIWQPLAFSKHPVRGSAYALLRVVAITLNGLSENHIVTRAAALSYSSLLGLGPLVAILVMVAGFALNQRDPTVAVHTINRVLKFIAPQVDQYENLDQGRHEPPATGEPAPNAAPTNPTLTRLINSFVTASRSGAAGAVGAVTLILIVIQLFTSVENAFNAVWGVRRGRSWVLRIVYYWTILTLGAVIFFTSFTALSAAAFINVFFEKLPYGKELLHLLRWMLPSFSILLLVGILTLFYRYIPNTRVFWKSALLGAVIVTALLFLNNYLAFLYFKRVVLQRSFYGSLGILPILMLGLYIFWFFVLVGGQISYAVQNAQHRRSQTVWNSLSETARESLSLLVLLAICRRFKQCQPGYSASELSQLIKIPTQILNESLNRLSDLGFVTPLPPAEGQSAQDNRYQPARPLERMTLAGFKQHFMDHGENPGEGMLELTDPVLRHYHDRLARYLDEAFGTQTLDVLLQEFPLQPAGHVRE